MGLNIDQFICVFISVVTVVESIIETSVFFLLQGWAGGHHPEHWYYYISLNQGKIPISVPVMRQMFQMS